MNIFHVFYLIGAAAAIFAGFPQLYKLFKSKQADEFSMSTWMVWLFAQVTGFAYALSMKDKLFAAVSLFWLAFYAVMVTLIFRYRNSPAEAGETILAEEA